MKTLCILVGLFLFGCVCQAQHRICLNVKQMAGKKVILAYYKEDKVWQEDTLVLDKSGYGCFQDDRKEIARGMYLLLFSPSNFVNLVIGDDQHFSVQADTSGKLEAIHIEGDPENLAFLAFQKFMTAENKKAQQIRDIYEKRADRDSTAVRKRYSAQIKELDVVVRSYIENLNREYPRSVLAALANFNLAPVIPDFSKDLPKETEDRDFEIQRKAFFYEKAHYWDYLNFQDSVLIRTPGFKSRLDDYFKRMVIQHPDTVFNDCARLVEKARGCTPMFRHMVAYCFDYVWNNKVMGMDAAFVKFSKRYILSGEANWSDQENLKRIEREVALTQHNLIGLTAPELKLPTLEGKWVSLHETKASFTLLLFWEEDCGHCKKQIPQVKKELLDRFEPYGFKVFAVHAKADREKWEKFVVEHELFDFINCWDPQNQSNFQAYYHVNSTPQMYLLDKDKKIIGKRLQIDQYADMLLSEYKTLGIDVK